MSDLKDYTDYHQYSWNVPKYDRCLTHFIRKKQILITIWILGSALASGQISSEQNVIIVKELQIFIFILSITVLCIILYLNYQVYCSILPKLSHYSIDRDGITANHKHTTFEEFETKKTINKINQEKPIKRNNRIFLSLPKKSSSLKLIFSNQKQLNKFTTSLKNYLKKK